MFLTDMSVKSSGSTYFLCASSLTNFSIHWAHRRICRFLATLYILHVIFNTATVGFYLDNGFDGASSRLPPGPRFSRARRHLHDHVL